MDLSCETLGGDWNADTNTCSDYFPIVGLDLSSEFSWSKKPRSIRVDDDYFKRKDPVEGPYPWRDGCLADTGSEDADGLDGPEFVSRSTQASFDPPFGAGDASAAGEARVTLLRGHGADLRHAKLTGIRFVNANLSGADLRSADLSGVTFEESILEAADLTGATVRGTQFDFSFLPGISLTTTWCQDCDRDDRIYFNSGYIDGSTLHVANPELLRIERASLVNSRVGEGGGFGGRPGPSGITTVPKEDDGASSYTDDDWWMPARERTIIKSNLTCAVVASASDWTLDGSNISGARFRALDDRRWKETPYKSSPDEFYADTPSWRLYWDMALPWTWADQTPTGLSGERFAVCDRATSTALASELRIGALPPIPCDIAKPGVRPVDGTTVLPQLSRVELTGGIFLDPRSPDAFRYEGPRGD